VARDFLRLPVVSEGAEHLVMGMLMRRNVLAYKAPPGNEGYDLICIHPDPRRQPQVQIRVQVKSRYQTDCDRGFPLKEKGLDAFDFLVVVFLNIGEFFGGKDGTKGAAPPEFYTLPAGFVAEHHRADSSWQKVRLRGLDEILKPYRDEAGFELIAKALGVDKPSRNALAEADATPSPQPSKARAKTQKVEPADRLAAVLKNLAQEQADRLSTLRQRGEAYLLRPDAVWHLLLTAFSTLGGSSGWDGLIGNQDNYRKVTYEAIKAMPARAREAEIEAVMRAAKVRYPPKKAKWLSKNFTIVEKMGGLERAKELLLAAPGRDAKIAFLKQFEGVGDKYGRDIMMDTYHPEFRDSVALDVRVRSVTDALGLAFDRYEAEEAFFVDVARRAGLQAWDVDRLLYSFRDVVLEALEA
jgi:hypothetical protein